MLAYNARAYPEENKMELVQTLHCPFQRQSTAAHSPSAAPPIHHRITMMAKDVQQQPVPKRHKKNPR